MLMHVCAVTVADSPDKEYIYMCRGCTLNVSVFLLILGFVCSRLQLHWQTV